ncbi:MAG: SDR family oxidoreductase [Deltaproteobacteria bacterium]|nr:SDR family oxidoreductase [Deltaproteobacteria bacterium]MCB9785095.1 SDR family oxidoreductase [Deltaproteobacteria bacterium]
MNRFEDKVVLVTGAGSGIGQATAFRVAEEGGRVAVVDIDAAGLDRTMTKLAAMGAEALALECDISDPEQVRATVAAAVERFGKLDALCNVAGILRSDHTHELRLEDWNRIIAVNLTGTFLMCQAALPHLLATRGYIVNTSSTAALGKHPWMAAYASSKGGVLSLTKCLAAEYVKQGLNVNAVIPGGIATPLHTQFSIPEGANPVLIQGAIPHVKYVGPEYAASAIAFLASSDARYMNGAEVRVDGGAMA